MRCTCSHLQSKFNHLYCLIIILLLKIKKQWKPTSQNPCQTRKKYCENKVKIKMTCSVVDTISHSNIANISCTQDLWWKPSIQLARRELRIKPPSLKSTKSQQKKREIKPTNRGKITNFHWNENKRTEKCLPLLQVVGDWKNNGSNHGSCRRWGGW